MATATIRIKKDTTANWTASGRVLDDGELGIEITEEGHRVIRVGDGVSAFMNLPVAVDIEAINAIKTGMDTNAKKYYEDMVNKGEEMLKKMEQQAITVELQDDETKIDYRMGISNGSLYFEEVDEKTTAPEDGDSDSPEESENENNEEVSE
jgi:hypothetical protein|nr:MAG TPA: hyaluronidase [Caudoviricetes sp.]